MMNRWIAALLMAGVFAFPAAAADAPTSSASEPPSPALPYAVAGLSTLLVLFTICKPSKKSFYEE